MTGSSTQELLLGTRQILKDARSLLTAPTVEGATDGALGDQAGVLALYDRLHDALERLDDARTRDLLGRVAVRIEELQRLSADIERLRSLRRALEGV